MQIPVFFPGVLSAKRNHELVQLNTLTNKQKAKSKRAKHYHVYCTTQKYMDKSKRKERLTTTTTTKKMPCLLRGHYHLRIIMGGGSLSRDFL